MTRKKIRKKLCTVQETYFSSFLPNKKKKNHIKSFFINGLKN